MANITSNPNNFMFLMIFGALGIVGVVGIVMATIMKVSSTKERELSRRQIASHIAEGSLSPEDGQRLLETKLTEG